MPEIDQADLAARYGFALAVLNSDPELKGLFNKAVSQTWTADRFQAELRATKWYQTHGEAWRNAAIQKAADPATYNNNVAQVRARLGMMASEVGSLASPSALDSMAQTAYQFGWDDNQLRLHLAASIQYENGRLQGQAGQWEADWREYAASQGLNYSDAQYEHWARVVGKGEATSQDVISQMRETAASAFPHLADRLRAGETVQSIAEPYRQTMASLLEMNPDAIGLSDPSIKKALASKDDKGQPALKTLWQFENDVRSDERWLKTQNAQNQAMSVTRKILNDFGLVS